MMMDSIQDYESMSSTQLAKRLKERNIPGRGKATTKEARVVLLVHHHAETKSAYSLYWEVGDRALERLVDRRMYIKKAWAEDKAQLIVLLLEQDAEETIRNMPTTEREKEARHAQLQTAIHHNLTETIPLLELPAELRNDIFKLAVVESEPVINSEESFLATTGGQRISGSLMLGRFHMEPGLLRTCKQIREETRSMYYAVQLFQYSSDRCHTYMRTAEPDEILPWLHHFDDRLPMLQNVEVIQRIILPSWSPIEFFANIVVRVQGKRGSARVVRLHRLEHGRYDAELVMHEAKEVVGAVMEAMPWVEIKEADLFAGEVAEYRAFG